MKPFGVIYMAKNRVNGKIYVGQTTNWSQRRTGHRASVKNPKTYFGHALAKYGIDGFEWSIIDTAICQEDLDQKEIYWIAHYNSTNQSLGYNLTHGGIGHSTLLTLEFRQRMSEALKGRHLSPNTEFKPGMLTWNKGKPWNEEARANMSKAQRGVARPKRKKHLLCVELNLIFKGIKETAFIFGRSAGNLCSAVKGTQNSWCGYSWRYASEMEVESVPHYEPGMNVSPVVPDKILCIELGQTFDRPCDATKALGIRADHLVNTLKGKHKICGGYHWQYLDSATSAVPGGETPQQLAAA